MISILRVKFYYQNSRITFVLDEDYTGHSAEGIGGWVHQQLCKLSVHRLGFADSYFVLDSDSYFIRPFGLNDFFTPSGLPRFVASPVFTVYHSNNQLLLDVLDGHSVVELPVIEAIADGQKIDLARIRQRSNEIKFQSPYDRGPLLDYVFDPALRKLAFQPSQFLVSEVLSELEKELLGLNSSFLEILALAPWEYNWYGSYCMFAKRVSCAPTMSPTIGFVSADMIAEARSKGVTHATLARHFSSIQMAARHHDETSLE